MTKNKIINRRDLIKNSLALAASTGLGGKLGFATIPGDRRLVVIILRGGLDSLALFPPFGDKNYARLRGSLAIGPDDGVIDLDGMFGLHPAAASLAPFWQRNEMTVVPAVATAYRTRLHFDAQEILESGSAQPGGADNGWLNRAAGLLADGGASAFAIGPQLPFILQGPATPTAWLPDMLPGPILGFDEKLRLLYKKDSFLASQLAEAIRNKQFLQNQLSKDDLTAAKSARRVSYLESMAHLAGQFLAQEDGARIAVLEAAGWDTHNRQGAAHGRLARKIAALAAGLDSLYAEMQGVWNKTAIVVVSEFGRTVGANDSGGTDHGTGTAALLLGGAILGGKITGPWPGLDEKALYEGRDIAPALDIRAVFKRLLQDHMQISPEKIDKIIFPNSGNIKPLAGLVRR